MEQYRKYVAPAILREMQFVPDGQILAGSVVDKATVTSVGQEVNDINWEAEGFNHTWEGE